MYHLDHFVRAQMEKNQETFDTDYKLVKRRVFKEACLLMISTGFDNVDVVVNNRISLSNINRRISLSTILSNLIIELNCRLPLE
jgi:hypothetical protein